MLIPFDVERSFSCSYQHIYSAIQVVHQRTYRLSDLPKDDIDISPQSAGAATAEADFKYYLLKPKNRNDHSSNLASAKLAAIWNISNEQRQSAPAIVTFLKL